MAKKTTSETEVRQEERVLFNGTYTLEHAKGHYTVRIKTQPKDSSFAPGSRVVSLMVGCDNEADFKGFGFVNHGRIILWKRFQNDPKIRRIVFLLTKAINLLEDRDQVEFEDHERAYTVLVSRYCMVCNRKLTNPNSIRLGVGPECASRMAA